MFEFILKIHLSLFNFFFFFYFASLLFSRKRVISRWIRAFLSNYHLQYPFHIQDLILKEEKKQKEHWIRSHVNSQMAEQAVWLIEKFYNHTSLRKASISFCLIYYCFNSFFFFASVSAVSIFSISHFSWSFSLFSLFTLFTLLTLYVINTVLFCFFLILSTFFPS